MKQLYCLIVRDWLNKGYFTYIWYTSNLDCLDDFPKVTVITVCFNAEENLENTLRSVLSQNYPNLEYLIIDGASTDRTLSIIRNHPSEFIRVYSQPDQGLYHAMNKGLHLASGEWVIFMNSGDTFYQEETLKRLIEAGHQADFIYGHPLVIGLKGDEQAWHKAIPDGNSIRPESFLKGMVVCHQALLVRTRIAPAFDLKFTVASDIDWTIQSLKRSSSIYYYPGYVCRYCRGGFSERRRPLALLERFQILCKHFGLYRTISAHLTMLRGK